MSTPSLAVDFAGFSATRRAARQGDDQALREAARQFEALFVRELLKSANAVSFGDDGLGEHGDLVRDLRDRQMAEHLTAGRGLGLADMLVRQLGAPPPPAAPRQLALASFAVHQPSAAHFSGPQDFVQALAPHAERAGRELGVSPRILLAQAALESGWGQHLPRQGDGASSHNLFGIKTAGGWQGAAVRAETTEFHDGQSGREMASFRSYADFAASFDDYVSFLRGNPRYANALRHAGDDARYLQELKSAGYATDPLYVDKIQRVANSPPLDQLI